MQKTFLFSILKFLLFSKKRAANGIFILFSYAITLSGTCITIYSSKNVSTTQFWGIIFVFFINYIVSHIFLHGNQYKTAIKNNSYEKAKMNKLYHIQDNIKKIYHDINQHFLIISGYLENREIEKCQNYINELLPNIHSIGNLIFSDNQILDYLINTKDLKTIQLNIIGSIEILSDMKDLDLVCLLGNILDNAIEATEKCKEKHIDLFFLKHTSNRIIMCKNPIEQSVLKNNKTLKTTKKCKELHGYGTKIIREIVSKYHGVIDYFEESDTFGVQIVLPLLN
ncbi:MAG: GHKL domain-containing protein [Eubacteriales bacterium]